MQCDMNKSSKNLVTKCKDLQNDVSNTDEQVLNDCCAHTSKTELMDDYMDTTNKLEKDSVSKDSCFRSNCVQTSQHYLNPDQLKTFNYLRENLLLPLTWAMSKVFAYEPSDPNYYLAYQLLRWRYNNVPKEEMNMVSTFISSKKMDY